MACEYVDWGIDLLVLFYVFTVKKIRQFISEPTGLTLLVPLKVHVSGV